MPNLIQIKRSTSNATVTGLSAGELAFTQASNTLFIGSPDGTSGSIAIGTKLNYGTLTANAVLVTNSTSFIDTIKVANAVITYLAANNALGGAGNILASNSTGGVYWIAGGAVGTNTDAQFTFTNTITFSNTITFNSSILANTANATSFTAGVYGSATAGLVANSTGIAVGNSTVNTSINSSSFSGTANNALYLGSTIASGYQTTAGLSANVATLTANAAGYLNGKTEANLNVNNALTANASTYLNGKTEGNLNVNSATNASSANNAAYLDGVIGSSYALKTYADDKAANAYSNAMSDTLSRSGSYTGNNTFGGTNTIFNSNVALGGIVSFNGSVNTAITPTANGTQDLGTADKRWGKLYLAGSTLILGNTTLSSTGNALTTNNLVVSTNATINTIIGTLTTISSNVDISSANVNMSSAYVNVRDISVSGNLIVSGTLTTIDTTTLQVKDSNIALATNNIISDTIDFGFYGLYNSSATQYYSGLFRDQSASTATNPVFHLFTTTTEPTTVVDTSAGGYKQGTLAAYLDTGAFIANSTVVNITANGTVSSALVANSITLTTALAASYGGTGQASYANGDLLYASDSTTLSKLSVPGSAANGQVLQITNNLPAYGTLDGGTF